MARAKKNAKAKSKSSARKGGATTVDVIDGEDVDYGDIAGDYKQDNTGNFWKFTKPKHKIRVLPFRDVAAGRVRAYLKEAKHFGAHPDHKLLNCIGKDAGCPICRVANTVTDKKLQKEYRPSVKYLMNIVDMDDPERKVQLYRAPKAIWSKVMDIVLDTEEYPDALDPADGIDFNITKEGEGFNTSYGAQPAMKRSACNFTGTIVDLVARDASFEDDADYEQIASEMVTG